MSLRDIATTMLWSQPLFVWMGLLTFLMLIVTASYGYALIKGKTRSIPTHMRLAAITLVSGAIHFVLALSIIL